MPTPYSMEIVYFGDRNARNRALLVSNKEWTRLGKILTEKAAKVDALETCLSRRRRETSKKMANDWDNTELVSIIPMHTLLNIMIQWYDWHRSYRKILVLQSQYL